MSAQNDRILHYYQKELQYLRNEGAAFAKQYPKIAKRLELSGTDIADPHVERLIEAFAYLTAKIQKNVDDQYPHVAKAILDTLYPQFTHPVPPATIIQFDTHDSQDSFSEGAEIPKETLLFTGTNDDTECYFRTAYPVQVWPVEVSDAIIRRRDTTPVRVIDIPNQRVLCLKIKPLSDPLNQLPYSRLRFYIDADRTTQDRICEMLFRENAPMVLANYRDDADPLLSLCPRGSVRHVGFDTNDNVMPFPSNAHDSYRLLYEYFHFPHKFCFFDLTNLHTREAGELQEIYIGIPDDFLFDVQHVNKDMFKLGCTPAINLFSKISEPIFVDNKETEYRLVGDVRREKTTEIHSVESVYILHESAHNPVTLQPYFRYQYSDTHTDFPMWITTTVPMFRSSYTGIDTKISFVNTNMDIFKPATDTVYAKVWCTNRGLAEYVSPGTLFQCEVENPASRVVTLHKPTPLKYPPLEGETLWRLISHVNTNHLSLSSDPKSCEAFKTILHLYKMDDGYVSTDIRAIKRLETRTVTRRTCVEAWRGFVHGTQVTFHVDETFLRNGEPFIFFTVLQKFLTNSAALNSFVECVVVAHGREKPWHVWVPENGEKSLL
ncbi:MAG: type VI secretion system baseplate subunit TssF [Alphaproteobacteria bacterium]|nr:MAG: type VI secretion system baseplate subunit TssF [Alphaproteobacteria bacterium]